MDLRHRLPADRLGLRELVALRAMSGWRVVFVACLGLMAVAIIAWTHIARLEDARIEAPGASVILPYPGASPEDTAEITAERAAKSSPATAPATGDDGALLDDDAFTWVEPGFERDAPDEPHADA